MAGFGNVWEGLKHLGWLGRVCQTLEAFGTVWEGSGRFETVWESVGGFGGLKGFGKV